MNFLFVFVIAAAATLSADGYTIASCREETWAKHIDEWNKGDGEWWLKWTLTRETGDLKVMCGKMKTVNKGEGQDVYTITAFKKFKIFTEEHQKEVDVKKVYEGDEGDILKSITFGIEDEPDHIPDYYDAVMFKPNIIFKKVMHNDGNIMSLYSCTDRKPHTENGIDFRQIFVKEALLEKDVDAAVLDKMQAKAHGTKDAFEGKITQLSADDTEPCEVYLENIP